MLRDVTSRFREEGRPTFTLQWMALWSDKLSDVFYSLERKTAGLQAHDDPVQDMISLVSRHVYELNQIVVVQRSLQLVNIAIGRAVKMRVKITNKHEISACVTVFRNKYGHSSINILFDSLFSLLGGGGGDISKWPRQMCYHGITAVPPTQTS